MSELFPAIAVLKMAIEFIWVDRIVANHIYLSRVDQKRGTP